MYYNIDCESEGYHRKVPHIFRMIITHCSYRCFKRRFLVIIMIIVRFLSTSNGTKVIRGMTLMVRIWKVCRDTNGRQLKASEEKAINVIDDCKGFFFFRLIILYFIMITRAGNSVLLYNIVTMSVFVAVVQSCVSSRESTICRIADFFRVKNDSIFK